jgi:hypothetical protein
MVPLKESLVILKVTREPFQVPSKTRVSVPSSTSTATAP